MVELFCDECKHLNPTEEKQDRNRYMSILQAHWCRKYEKYLYHGLYHPKIVRWEGCKIDEEEV